MAGIISSTMLSAALSLSLLAPNTIPQSWIQGHDPVAVATVQAQLDVLGYNAGPLTGQVTPNFYHSVANFVTQFGIGPKASFTTQVADIVRTLPALPSYVSGASVLAVQSWLQEWKLYQGALNGRMSPTLSQSVKKFQTIAGLSATGVLNGPTLSALAHLATVRVAAHKRWTYAAQPGDKMRLLAWAAGVPLKTFERANAEHGTLLWVGQPVVFYPKVSAHTNPIQKPDKRASSPRVKIPAHRDLSSVQSQPAAQSSSGSSTPSTGVLSNLQPIAAFVLYDPQKAVIQALLSAQKRYPHALIDVAITGEWALTHTRLMKALAKSGNEIIMDGYSGVSLNTLPDWGIRQEVTWSVKALSQTTGQTPVFISQSVPFQSSVLGEISAQNVIALSPSVVVTQSHWATVMVHALLDHPEGVVGSVYGPQSSQGWDRVFQRLATDHFVFLTLGQVWANGG
ncbi:MAG: peptidoglycan-binding protein [Sulfobacillus thermotolerans]|nr:peptidoglycan-binding protein [Sulfobacillus thermotolerans]